jgi:hypothetical protein
MIRQTIPQSAMSKTFRVVAQMIGICFLRVDAYSGETVPLIPEQTGHLSERSDAGVFVLG